jgi:hypothetical protein
MPIAVYRRGFTHKKHQGKNWGVLGDLYRSNGANGQNVFLAVRQTSVEWRGVFLAYADNSWQVIFENEIRRNVFGPHPNGFLVLTREGGAIVVTTAQDRRAGRDDAERAALHRSMLADSGKYRVEGSDFVTAVDVSWNEEWNAPSRGGTFDSRATSYSSSRH